MISNQVEPDVVAQQRLDGGQLGQHLGQIGVADGLAVGGRSAR